MSNNLLLMSKNIFEFFHVDLTSCDLAEFIYFSAFFVGVL